MSALLTKTCGCLNHRVPHWIYQDLCDAWAASKVLARGAVRAFMVMDSDRLAEKKTHLMQLGPEGIPLEVVLLAEGDFEASLVRVVEHWREKERVATERLRYADGTGEAASLSAELTAAGPARAAAVAELAAFKAWCERRSVARGRTPEEQDAALGRGVEAAKKMLAAEKQKISMYVV